jgi:aminoglycoside 3-N-acetyltransferase
MTSFTYDRRTFAEALAQVGVRAGDVVFSHSNVGYFGMPAGCKNADEACELLLAATFDVLGPGGTLVVPTFTYSFCKGQPFDVDQTPSTCGRFTEWMRKHPSAHRSGDPIFSVAAIGARAEELTRDLPPHCFGPGSFWDRFLHADGIVCNWNLDAGSTFLHHVERCLSVPYRYDKEFRGEFVKNGARRTGFAVFFCQDMSNADTSAVFEPFDALARQRGIARSEKVGRGAVVALRARSAYDLLAEQLKVDPWLLTEAGKAGRGASVRLMPPPAQALDVSLTDAWSRLADLPRDLVSPGIDITLATLARHFPLVIHEVPTGTWLDGRLVPEHWECLEASLRRSPDEPPLNVPLSPVRYGVSFEGTVPRDELLAHVHSDPDNPERVPERFGYYERTWGLCMPHTERQRLEHETYHVRIKTRFRFGSMKLGEWIVPGASEESILLFTEILGTGSLDACRVMLEMCRGLPGKADDATYRILIAPAGYGMALFRHVHPDVPVRAAIRFAPV